MEQLHVITDLQYGSTGKGLFAGYLADKLQPDTIVTAWGPNSGHTFMDSLGNKFVTCALPSGMFTSPRLKKILLGPGSVIDINLLLSELEVYANYMHGVDLLIHPNAVVVTQEHRDREAQGSLTKIGSTLKGVSEAMIDKIRRPPSMCPTAEYALVGTPLEGYLASIPGYDDAIDASNMIIIEGSQGFSLSINHGFYPYVTSRDCTMAQLLVDCAMPMNSVAEIKVYGVCRTFPIRVNNRDGWSGPCYWDQREIKWEDIGVEPELTTVTKLPRRIFTFSESQIRDAVRMNGVNHIFLNFANYCKEDPDLAYIIEQIERYTPVDWVGRGPRISDIQEWK